MQAIEFQTYISNGTIKIPKDYSRYNNKKAKIIMFVSDDDTGNYNKQKLVSAFEEARELNIFSEIENTVEWQKQVRNEWE